MAKYQPYKEDHGPRGCVTRKDKNGKTHYEGRADALRDAIMRAITVEDVRQVVGKLVAMAKDGNLQAIRIMLFHLIGNKPFIENAVVQENYSMVLGTSAPPRSEEKIAVMADRIEQGLEACSPDDNLCKHGIRVDDCQDCLS